MNRIMRGIAEAFRLRIERGSAQANVSRQTRIFVSAVYCLLPVALLLMLLAWPGGCTPNSQPSPGLSSERAIRVRLLIAQEQVVIAASQSPSFRLGSDGSQRSLNLARNIGFPVRLNGDKWQVGDATLGTGTLTLLPGGAGSLTVNGRAYRGQYRFVPAGGGRFDVINDVDIDDYLKGVLPRELLATWSDETYRAQAIVARTYALYEKHSQLKAAQQRDWDVFADQRSQVYGGLSDESFRSRSAVDATSGIVLSYGPPGQERIFKAYFSSCCGGITQSVADAFNEPLIQPLNDQDAHGQCSACPKFNWGPVVIRKDELTRRFKAWGAKKGRPEKDMATIARVDIQAMNRWRRPVRFVVTDIRGVRYSLGGEEFRWACNTEAVDGATLNSSFVNVISDSDAIRFVDGHGWGHAVGMCQWCAQARASAGWAAEDILMAAYPGSKLGRAY